MKSSDGWTAFWGHLLSDWAAFHKDLLDTSRLILSTRWTNKKLKIAFFSFLLSTIIMRMNLDYLNFLCCKWHRDALAFLIRKAKLHSLESLRVGRRLDKVKRFSQSGAALHQLISHGAHGLFITLRCSEMGKRPFNTLSTSENLCLYYRRGRAGSSRVENRDKDI